MQLGQCFQMGFKKTKSNITSASLLPESGNEEIREITPSYYPTMESPLLLQKSLHLEMCLLQIQVCCFCYLKPLNLISATFIEKTYTGFSPDVQYAQSAPVLWKSKQPSGINCRTGEDRKSHPTKGPMHSKTGSYKSTLVSKPKVDSRRQLGSQNGIGPGRPLKTHVATMEKKASASVAKNIPPSVYKPSSCNVQSSVSKQHMEQKRGLQEPIKAKMMPKQAVASSKPQVNKLVKHVSSHAPSQHNHPEKKPVRWFSDDEDEDEDEKALSLIRRMLNTQRFTGWDDDDDSDVEANFDDIMKEERRSAKIAGKEDEEQLCLIEEEEQRERMRELAKKCKLSH